MTGRVWACEGGEAWRWPAFPQVAQERSGHFARQINGRAEPEHLATMALLSAPVPCDRV